MLKLDDLTLRLHPADNVVVVKRPLKPGVELECGPLRIKVAKGIPPGHKLAVAEIPGGTPVTKYGQTIGFAKGRILPGEHVHTHNVELRDFGRDYAFGVDARPVAYRPAAEMRSFPGYARPGGKAGTRNYIGIISSVNCSAGVSRYVADRFRGPDFARDFPGVDGVVPFTHKIGCGIQPGAPHELLQRVSAGIARHPNIAGYVMIGLGCEVNQVHLIAEAHQLGRPLAGEAPPTFLTIQNSGGVRKTVEAAAAAVAKLLPAANALKRTPQPISKLILAENCGGSDGNSGITANPALGVASDELVRYGGTSVLAETPEIYGAEHLLTRRAVSPAVGQKIVDLIHWWEAYARANGGSIDNNPSYGNKEGGLTTIYEKSLGAVAKGGQSPLAAVYAYAEEITTPGFGFMDTPGYDPVSMTGLVSGGCNIGVFTTGRGSVYGCKPSPCIKVATNTAIYNHMIEDMDINAGTILDGTETVEQVGQRIFEEIIAVASGKKTKSELAGLGDDEFAPWLLGAQF